jgi:hypothetical protein
MTSFWLADRNRSDAEDRTPPRVKELLNNLEDARQALVAHPVYARVDSVESMHVFMSFHIWAVWDFMCLLKGLQVSMSCVQVPWFPQGDRTLRRLVNEIVVAEETDEDGLGGFAAHFELYLDSMDQCGADSASVHAFIEALRGGADVTSALDLAGPPEGARVFTKDTCDIIASESLPAIAAAFTFGREDVVPLMFQEILDQVKSCDLASYDRFIYYLDRHIAVDTDEHGPMAFEMINLLCGDDEEKWAEAEASARRHIESRIRLWDGALEAIEALGALPMRKTA